MLRQSYSARNYLLSITLFSAAHCSNGGTTPQPDVSNPVDTQTVDSSTLDTTVADTTDLDAPTDAMMLPEAARDVRSDVPDGPMCTRVRMPGHASQLDLYVMLDQSAAMLNATVAGETLWSAATGAIQQFVTAPESAGTGIGIQYFGVPPAPGRCPATCTTDDDCGTYGPCLPSGMCTTNCSDSCTTIEYSMPSTEIADLPGAMNAITGSLGTHSPSTGRPLSTALRGALDHSVIWEASHSTHSVGVVLITSGVQNECVTIDPATIPAIGLNGSRAVRTFVISLGSLGLDGVAAAGGTTHAFTIDTTQPSAAQTLAALQSIRGFASCSYDIPAQDGVPVTPGHFRLEYVSGGTTTPLVHVADRLSCTSDGNSWYFSDTATSGKMVLCDQACATAAVPGGEVDVVVTCGIAGDL